MSFWKIGIVAILYGTTLAVMAQTAQIVGEITKIQGQRLEITVNNSTKQWFSVRNADAVLNSSLVGKKVTSDVTKVGDSIVLVKPTFSN